MVLDSTKEKLDGPKEEITLHPIQTSSKVLALLSQKLSWLVTSREYLTRVELFIWLLTWTFLPEKLWVGIYQSGTQQNLL